MQKNIPVNSISRLPKITPLYMHTSESEERAFAQIFNLSCAPLSIPCNL